MKTEHSMPNLQKKETNLNAKTMGGSLTSVICATYKVIIRDKLDIYAETIRRE